MSSTFNFCWTRKYQWLADSKFGWVPLWFCREWPILSLCALSEGPWQGSEPSCGGCPQCSWGGGTGPGCRAWHYQEPFVAQVSGTCEMARAQGVPEEQAQPCSGPSQHPSPHAQHGCPATLLPLCHSLWCPLPNLSVSSRPLLKSSLPTKLTEKEEDMHEKDFVQTSGHHPS